MRPLTATESINPALARTKLILFTPFRKGRTWKLCATAYVSRFGTIFLPFPFIYLVFLPFAERAGRLVVIALVAAVLVVTAISVAVFYLGSRLQFAYFDMVVNRGEFVAPAWRKYRGQYSHWTNIKLLAGTVATLACALPIAAYVRHVVPLFQQMSSLPHGQRLPPQVMTAIFAGYAGYILIFLIFGVLFLISSLLSDFLVPSLALEDTGLKEAWRRMAELIRREPGEFAIYTLLKLGLGFAGYMGAVIAWELVLLIVTLVLFLICGLIGFLLHLIGVPSAILAALAVLIGIAWYIFIVFYSMMFAIGPVFTFLDAYALYFLGGRYPMLGDLLDASTPPPSTPVAGFPPPAPPPPLPNVPPPHPLESGAL